MKKRPKDGLLILVSNKNFKSIHNLNKSCNNKEKNINLGNIKLESLSPKKLRKKFICSSHFERNAYSNPTAPKSRLNRNAVPNKYLSK